MPNSSRNRSSENLPNLLPLNHILHILHPALLSTKAGSQHLQRRMRIQTPNQKQERCALHWPRSRQPKTDAPLPNAPPSNPKLSKLLIIRLLSPAGRAPKGGQLDLRATWACKWSLGSSRAPHYRGGGERSSMLAIASRLGSVDRKLHPSHPSACVLVATRDY